MTPYGICLFLSDLAQGLTRPSMLQMAEFHSFLWLSNIPLYIYIYIHLGFLYPFIRWQTISKWLVRDSMFSDTHVCILHLQDRAHSPCPRATVLDSAGAEAASLSWHMEIREQNLMMRVQNQSCNDGIRAGRRGHSPAPPISGHTLCGLSSRVSGL